jgi:hypothetical protein
LRKQRLHWVAQAIESGDLGDWFGWVDDRLAVTEKGFWTPEKRRALCLMAEGVRHVEIVAELGVSERTLDRWRKREEFREALVERGNVLAASA